ncbi:MAG: hypothetical protein ABMA26_15895 [Limisphaerales bacterium]
MIKFKHKSRWKPAPEGIHNAVVVDVIGDSSAVGASATGCDSIRVVWEIEATQTNGRRFTVTKIYPGANAFTQDFEAVLPAEHPLVTGDTENVESIIGTSNFHNDDDEHHNRSVETRRHPVWVQRRQHPRPAASHTVRMVCTQISR